MQALVWGFFFDTGALIAITDRVEPLCWPYFQNCWRFRVGEQALSYLTLIGLAGVSLAVIALEQRRVRLFWIVLVALNVMLVCIVSMDYRLRSNEFYMLLWINAVFLFWPAKRWSIPLVLVSFYFWAGTLKLNREWLSGAVLYHDLFIIPTRYAWLACSYVVVLELVQVWALLSTRLWLRLSVLGQLALFHWESLSQIHWFYPALMTAMLSWFVIEKVVAGSPTANSRQLLRFVGPKSAYALLGIFALCQLVPYLYPGDKALTGQGRLFALHMFEARQECDVSATIHRTFGPDTTIDLKMYGFPPRTICDPVVYFDRAQNMCRGRSEDPTLGDLDLRMNAKRATDSSLTLVIDAPHFCSSAYTFNLVRGNDWMK